MTLALYWDTEGTGLRDPWLQEYAGLLVQTSSDTEVWRSNALVQLPYGITPQAEALAVHGITAEMCATEGIPVAACCQLFWEQVSVAELLVGFNIEFDLKIMRAMSMKSGIAMAALPRIVELSDWAEPLCQLPPTPKMLKARRFGFKRPSLSEAMRILCPSYSYTAHRAMPDVLACRHLHRAIKEKLDEQKTQAEKDKQASTGVGGNDETPE